MNRLLKSFCLGKTCFGEKSVGHGGGAEGEINRNQTKIIPFKLSSEIGNVGGGKGGIGPLRVQREVQASLPAS